MTTADAIPLIDTDALPMGVARDQAWRATQVAPLIAIADGYAVTTRRGAEEVLKHPDPFSSAKAFEFLQSPVPLVPIAYDPPTQTRYRQILQPFFSPRVIKPLEAELRRQIVALIDPIARRGHCDYVSEVAQIFPIQAFLTFFGLPLEMRDQFWEWKKAVIGLASAGFGAEGDAAQDGIAKALEMYTYFTELIPQRRSERGADILSQILAQQPPNDLTDPEAVGLCFLFTLAGLDTVTDTLSCGMQRLAERPDKRQEIIDDPALIPAAVEELVRLDPPAPFIPRVTSTDAQIDSVRLPPETRVTTYLGAVNRDPAVFENPYDIDFRRPENPHISFGLGPHRCLGSHLARLELAIVYDEWHKRIPHYRIKPGTTPKVHWPHGTIELESLHLEFDKAEG
jgi:cytochrome P450